MRVKYLPSGNASFSKWLRIQSTTAWNYITSRGLRPLVDPHAKYVFIVGCGHSGTTLLSSRLGNHSEILLIARETYNFQPWCHPQAVRQAIVEWDHFARFTGKSIVLEKTPKHIHSVARILKTVPNAQFLVTTRNALDNIASLYKRYGNLENCINRWQVDNLEVKKILAGQNPCLHVSFESLTSAPAQEFRSILQFLKLPWEEEILASGATGYDRSGTEGNMRVRHQQISRPIQSNTGKWKKILSASQASKVTRQTREMSILLGYESETD